MKRTGAWGVAPRRTAVLAAALLTAAATASSHGAEDERLPIPDAAAVRQATSAVASIFEDKAAKARTPDERAAVAREMFAVLPSTKDPTERYAIQAAAIDVATRGNDPALLLDIAGSLAKEYRLDRAALAAPRLEQMTGSIAPEAWAAVAPRLQELAQECAAASRFDVAGGVIDAYALLGKRAKDPRASAVATGLRKSLADRRKAEEKLAALVAEAKRPGADPKVFTDLGELLCFGRGDWAAGLPYLAKSPDAALAAVAAKDIAASSPEQRMAAAEAWARLGQESAPVDQEPYYDRATAIYAALLPTLSGLARVKAEKSLDTILESANARGRDGNQWVVIFRSQDPRIWNTDSRTDPKNYAVPLASVPATMRFVRIRRANGEAVIMPLTKAVIGSEWKGEAYGWQGACREIWGATPLGIFETRQNVDAQTGEVAIYASGRDVFTGWGYGHRVRHGGPTQACWHGDWIALEPLEISVTARNLTQAERSVLLP